MFLWHIQSKVTYLNFSYLNTSVIRTRLAKPYPLFPATFVDAKLALAVQMANIECFRARSTRCIDFTGKYTVPTSYFSSHALSLPFQGLLS